MATVLNNADYEIFPLLQKVPLDSAGQILLSLSNRPRQTEIKNEENASNSVSTLVRNMSFPLQGTTLTWKMSVILSGNTNLAFVCLLADFRRHQRILVKTRK